jgi:hypothetical protein
VKQSVIQYVEGGARKIASSSPAELPNETLSLKREKKKRKRSRK